MRVKEIEILFQSEDTLEKVLEECKEDFDKVDYYIGILKDDIVTDNAEEAKKALSHLTGVYMNLNTVLAIAETEKKNREIRHYNKLRMDKENLDKKFVSAVGEKEASGFVGEYRRVRNYIQAYKEDCEKAITTLQSILKQIQKEMDLSGKEER